METGVLPRYGDILNATLNRTIVGWKQAVKRELIAGLGTFKSHHSGMETSLENPERARGLNPLNRTIVGWKPAVKPNGWPIVRL